MSEHIPVPNTCLILDLITGLAVHTKRGVYCVDGSGPSIENINILSGTISVSKDNATYQLSVFHPPSPVISSAFSLEPEVFVEEEDRIPFLPSPLLRASVHVILDDDSRSPSPVEPPKRRGRKGKKVFKKE
jgi:hypothetical protein